MTLNPDVVRARCSEIEESVQRLEALAVVPLADFLADRDVQDIASYRLLVAIEAALALCYHVSSRRLRRTPEDYAGCFALLGDAGILEPALTERLRSWSNPERGESLGGSHRGCLRVRESCDLRAFARRRARLSGGTVARRSLRPRPSSRQACRKVAVVVVRSPHGRVGLVWPGRQRPCGHPRGIEPRTIGLRANLHETVVIVAAFPSPGEDS